MRLCAIFAALLALVTLAASLSFEYECTICSRIWADVVNDQSSTASSLTSKHCTRRITFTTDSITNLCMAYSEGRCFRYLNDPVGGGWAAKYPHPFDIPFQLSHRIPIDVVYGRPPGQHAVSPRVFTDRWCPRIVEAVFSAKNLDTIRASCPANNPKGCCDKLIKSAYPDSFCSNPSTGQGAPEVKKTEEEKDEPIEERRKIDVGEMNKAIADNKRAAALANANMNGDGEPDK